MSFEQKNKYTLYIKISSNNINHDLFNYYKEIEMTCSTREDSGIDLNIPFEIRLKDYVNEYDTVEINHMINCMMVDNMTGLTTGYYLYPRSSIYKYPFYMANSVGIIDSGYRGDIKAMVKTNDLNYRIKQGSRIFQICAPDLSPLRVKVLSEGDNLPNSSRNANGFGSSGY
jgi:dUTP pyrophosphatase